MIQDLQEPTRNFRTRYEPTSKDYWRSSFPHFFFEVFGLAVKRVENRFEFPSHLLKIAIRVQEYKKTATIAPRFHLKSTLAQAYICWMIYNLHEAQAIYQEWSYMSYVESLAAYHLKRIKRYIRALPEFYPGLEDMTRADGIISFSANGHLFHCEPDGVFNFKRGKHPDGMICDDILRDPTKRLDIGILKKIETAFLEEIESMPKDQIHVFGTPQDQEDLFTVLEKNGEYNVRRYDAILSEQDKKPWWPHGWPWDKLEQKRKTIGEKAFRKEFRCVPVRGSETFVNWEVYEQLMQMRINYQFTDKIPWGDADREVIAGFDIGKKTHPSHLAVFISDRKAHRLFQVHSFFMDGWDYKDQIEYLTEMMLVFKVQRLLYDNTRAEFENAYERGELPDGMEGVVFTAKNKFTMATNLDILLSERRIYFLKDDRQKRQILSVDSALQAPETDEGHGDAFFSICLAINGFCGLSNIKTRTI